MRVPPSEDTGVADAMIKAIECTRSRIESKKEVRAFFQLHNPYQRVAFVKYKAVLRIRRGLSHDRPSSPISPQQVGNDVQQDQDEYGIQDGNASENTEPEIHGVSPSIGMRSISL